jgi:hypothetical protein
MKELITKTIHQKFIFTMLSVCTAMSVLLAGCSLARTDKPENTGTDRLCGVWVVSDTSICYDNPDGFEEDGANFIGISELTDAASNTQSSTDITTAAETPVFTRGNISMDKYVQDTDDIASSTLSVTGVLYLSSDKPTDEYVVPIYQRPDGTYYRGVFSATSWYADNRIPTPFSIAATETTSSSEGLSQSDKTEITIAFEVRDACTDARIIEMDKDSLVIKTTALDLNHPAITGASEYDITTLPDTKFVIVEESSATGTSTKIYRTIYCRSGKSGSLPATHIIAVPGDSEVLIPQKLQITFG